MKKEEYLNTQQLAEKMKTSQRTLERWRMEGQGPEYYKLGRKVIYKSDDVIAYLEANKYSHTSQY